MLDAAREAVGFGAGSTTPELLQNRMLALAIIRCIEIIGEAAFKVSPETRARHPEIPWVDIIGMRHRLVHAYFDVDLNRLCDTISEDLPPLIAMLEAILPSAA